MKVIKFNQPNGGSPGYFVKVSHKEALSLVESLVAQMIEGTNSNRLESYTEDGQYFTIAVLTDKEIEWERNKNTNQS